jgi:hypothetical protein
MILDRMARSSMIRAVAAASVSLFGITIAISRDDASSESPKDHPPYRAGVATAMLAGA